jgi:hypothetical protein
MPAKKGTRGKGEQSVSQGLFVISQTFAELKYIHATCMAKPKLRDVQLS